MHNRISVPRSELKPNPIMTEVKHRVETPGLASLRFSCQPRRRCGVELVAAFARNPDKASAWGKVRLLGYSDLELSRHQGMNVVTVGSVSGVHLEHVRSVACEGSTPFVKSLLRSDHLSMNDSGLRRAGCHAFGNLSTAFQ